MIRRFLLFLFSCVLFLFSNNITGAYAGDVSVSYPYADSQSFTAKSAVRRADGSIIVAATRSDITEGGSGVAVYKIDPVNNTITQLCGGSEDAVGELSLRSDGTVIVPTTDNSTTAYMKIIAINNTVTTKAQNDTTTTAPMGTGTIFCDNYGNLDFLSSSLAWTDWGYWIHGSGKGIYTSSARPDGKVILAGSSGKWAVYSNSSCVASGTISGATTFQASISG